MKNYKKYLLIIILFIVFDAFHRSISHAIYVGRDKNSMGEFASTLSFLMVYFILFFSWFYWPIVISYLLISNFFKREHYVFVVSGLVTALLFYFLYCKLYSVFEVGYPEFYFRIVMYSLMGAYFGSVRFKTMKASA